MTLQKSWLPDPFYQLQLEGLLLSNPISSSLPLQTSPPPSSSLSTHGFPGLFQPWAICSKPSGFVGSSSQTVSSSVLHAAYILLVGCSSYLVCRGPPVDASWLMVHTTTSSIILGAHESCSHFLVEKAGAQLGDWTC